MSTSARIAETHLKLAVACLAGALALQGCAPKSASGPKTPVYAYDQTGAARSCTAPSVSPVAGKQTEAAISVGDDGGWCAISVQQDGKPYTAGLVMTRPKHGKVFVHAVGDDTRIDYTPALGFAGPDSFTVKLVPGDAVVAVAATVTPAGKN